MFLEVTDFIFDCKQAFKIDTVFQVGVSGREGRMVKPLSDMIDGEAIVPITIPIGTTYIRFAFDMQNLFFVNESYDTIMSQIHSFEAIRRGL